MKPIPEVGKYYHFFDDGKTSPGRHYIARVERIVPISDSPEILVPCMDPYLDELIPKSLWDIWNTEKTETSWVFSPKTDVLLEVSCPKYDENKLWFARTKSGGWFSMDIQSGWQGGLLDVTNEVYESVLENAEEYGMDTDAYTKETY
jgi:hypothetical protein